MFSSDELTSRLMGRAGGMRHKVERKCDGDAVRVLVDDTGKSLVVTPVDVETVVGPRGAVFRVGFGLACLGLVLFVVVALCAMPYV